jgi:ankyrin repeat protein
MPVTNHNIIRQPENLAAFYKIPETDSTTSTKTTSTAGGAEAAPTSTGTTAQEEILTYSEEEHGTLDEFQSSSSFEPFKKQYIDDIAAMKVAVTKYLPEGRAYELTEKLETFQEHLFVDRSFFSTNIDDIFGETKTQFHHLATTINAETLTDEKRVACLEQALGEIDLCSEGVATNVGNADTLLRYVMCGIDGDLATIRTDLLTAEAQAFASEHHSDTEFWEANEIHLVNRYLAALPQELGLSMTVDRFRQPVSDELLQQFTLRAETILTPMKIAWTLADGYFDKLAGILAERNIQTTEDRDLGVLFGQAGDKNDLKEKIEELVTSPLKRVAPTFHAYQLLTEGNNGEYNFKDARSILRHEVSHGLLKALSTRAPEPSVFTHIGERHHHIMQLDGMQYWLENFASEKKPLTTAHLNKLDLSTWPPNVVNDLCGQAIAQTTEIEDLLSFVSNHKQYFTAQGLTSNSPQNICLNAVRSGVQHALEEKLSRDPIVKQSLLAHIKSATAEKLEKALPLVEFGAEYRAAYLDRAFEQKIEVSRPLAGNWLKDLDVIAKTSPNTLLAHLNAGHSKILQTAFEHALVRGNNSAFSKLVAADNRFVTSDHGNVTTLHRACDLGHQEIVKTLLVGAFGDPNQKDSQGATLLYRAAAKNHVGVVQVLLDSEKVDANLQGGRGETPLYIAAKLECLEIIRALLSHQATRPNEQSENGETALTQACANSSEEVIKILLANSKTDPNAANAELQTPLRVACEYGNLATVQLMLDQPTTDPNIKSKDGFTPLSSGIASENRAVVDVLLSSEKTDPNQKSSGATNLYRACATGDIDIVRALLSHNKIDLNAVNSDGSTALHAACFHNHTNIALEILQRHNIETNKEDDRGMMPIHWAAAFGNHEVVAALSRYTEVEASDYSYF